MNGKRHLGTAAALLVVAMGAALLKRPAQASESRAATVGRPAAGTNPIQMTMPNSATKAAQPKVKYLRRSRGRYCPPHCYTVIKTEGECRPNCFKMEPTTDADAVHYEMVDDSDYTPDCESQVILPPICPPTCESCTIERI